MTTLIRLPGVKFTGIKPVTDARVINGALVLIDNTHPLATKTTAAAGSAAFTNIAATKAQATIGSALATIPTFDSTTSATHAKIGYTAAGSPHLTSSITADVAQEQVGLLAPANLLAYLQANNTHSFYLEVAYRITREIVPTSASQFVYAGITTQLGWAGPPIGIGRTPAPAVAGYPGSSDPRRAGLSSDSVGSEIAHAISATDLSPLASTAPINQFAITGPNSATQWLHRTPSWILRSLWLVDLTIAGLTHAQAWAIGQAAHTAACADRWTADTGGTPLA